MKRILALSSLCAAFAASAASVVSDVTMTQDGETVTIGYTLSGEPAIITIDILADGASIGGQYLTYFAGDANRRVEPGVRSITWKPRKAWPNNELNENVKAEVRAWPLDAPPPYMAISLEMANDLLFYASADVVPFGVTNDLYKTDYLLMRKVPAANVTWRMGSTRELVAEIPHLVKLSADYYLGVYEITQRQYELLTGQRPSRFRNVSVYATRPVENVSYDMIRGAASGGFNWPADGHAVASGSFLGLLRALSGLEGIDLPTEAQWEYACRAGSGEYRYGSGVLDDLGRYNGNGGRPDGADPSQDCTDEVGTAKVGSYAANAWGFYDMLGNVREWCLDWFQTSYEEPAFSPETGPESGSGRVFRGGSWKNDAWGARSSSREPLSSGSVQPNFGFRVACPASIP